MATIVAVCPYCRAGGVRAPESMLGASANCPKCGSSFTVMPSEGAPGWNSNIPPAAAKTSPALVPPARPSPPAANQTAAPPPVDDTKPTSTLLDATSPVGKDERKSPAPAPAATTPPDDPEEATDSGLVVALSALALVGVAVVATLFPFGRFIATGVAGLGFVGGLACLGAEGRARTAGALACGLHFLILFLVLLFPSWVGLSSWRQLVIVDAPPAPQAFSHKNYQTSLAQWVDSSAASWQFDDVRVTVVSTTLGPVELTGPMGAKQFSPAAYLQLLLRVDNFGPKRGIDLSGWVMDQNLETVQVTDSNGRTLNPAKFEGDWQLEPTTGHGTRTLYPGKFREVKLLFTAPQSKFDYLRVVLPGTVFGFKEEEVRFQINAGSILRVAPSKK